MTFSIVHDSVKGEDLRAIMIWFSSSWGVLSVPELTNVMSAILTEGYLPQVAETENGFKPYGLIVYFSG